MPNSENKPISRKNISQSLNFDLFVMIKIWTKNSYRGYVYFLSLISPLSIRGMDSLLSAFAAAAAAFVTVG